MAREFATIILVIIAAIYAVAAASTSTSLAMHWRMMG